MIDEQWRSARRILAIRLDNLGDMLVTTPSLHAIKTSLPAAQLTLLASSIGAQVARLNPDLSDVIVFAAQVPPESALQEVIITPLTETSWP